MMRVARRWLVLVPALMLGCNFGSSSKPPPADAGPDTSFQLGAAALSASPATGSFGTVAVGSKSAPVTITVSNSGGTATGVLSASVGGSASAVFTIDSDACSGSPLPAGQSCAVKLHFAPTAAGAQQASLGVGDGNVSASVALTGTGAMSAPPGTLAVTPTTQDFGTLATGATSAPVSFTFANGGGTATPPLTVTLTGADAADFQLTDPCSGKPLNAGASCKVSVVFAPPAVGGVGSKTASLAGAAQGLGTATASLSGTAAAPAAFTVMPATFDFGSILQGSPTAKQTFTVQNVGGVASGVPAVATSGASAGDFAISDSTCTSALAASAKCTFDVAFTPATASAESATVTASATGTTSGTAALTGTGLAPAAIALNPTSESFGSWQQGKVSPDTTFTLTNTGGVQTGVLAASLGGTDASQFVIDGDGCSGTQLAATTGSCTIGVHFAPTAPALGSVQATLEVTGTPGGSTAASLTGTSLAPAALGISPASKAFGTWPWNGASPAQSFTVTNSGGVATGTLTASLGGANPGDFSTSSDTCTGQSLAPNGTCTVSAAFTPQGDPLGALSAALDVGDGTVSTSAGLSATSAEPASLGITAQSGFTGFGSVVLNTPTSATFTVTNGGMLTSGTIAMSVSGSAEYTLVNDTCSNTTLGAGATCTVGVTFDPTAPGSAPGQLELTASPGGPASYTLSGNGVTQAALAISPPVGFPGFGTQQAGTAGISAVYTVTNTGGVVSGALGVGLGSLNPAGDFTITANGCAGQSLGPGATCTVTVQFTPPAGTTGSETASLAVNASPGGNPSVGLSGTSYTPAVISMQPPSGFTGFGNVPIGNSSIFQFTLTNSGSQAAGAPSISTSNPLFTISGSTCGGGISTSCTFDVTFTPTSPPGTESVTITATSSPGGTASYGPTSGTGTGAVLSLSPSSWNATYNTCTNETQDFTITNTGNVATTSPISISLAGAAIGPFQTGSYTCLTDLQPNTPCTIPLTFECPTLDSADGVAGSGTMTISAGGAVAQSATLDVGAGVAISPNPGMAGVYVTVGNSYTQTFTITNYTTTATHAFGAYVISGAASQLYTATDISCAGVALQPYGSGQNTCQFKVTFSPTSGTTTVQDVAVVQAGYYIVGTTVVFATLSEGPLEAYQQP